jgi:hypothetical protein
MKKITVLLVSVILFSCAVKKKQTEVVKNTESLALKENATAVNKKSDLFSNSTDFITDYSFVTKKTYRLVDSTKPGSVTDAAGKKYNLDNAQIVEVTERKNTRKLATKTAKIIKTEAIKSVSADAKILKTKEVTSTKEIERPKAVFSWWYLLLGFGVGFLSHRFFFK